MQPSSTSRVISFDILIVAGILIQLISFPLLWRHGSNTGTLFGQFSLRDGLVLSLNAASFIVLVILFALRRRVASGLSRLRPLWAYLGFGLVLIALVWLGFVAIESELLEYIAVDLILVGLILIWQHPPALPSWILPAAAALALPLMLITVLINFPFSPDEAHWADYASTAITGGGIYARTWMQAPTPIYPGIGWSVAGYGWALEHIAFDIRVGRLWNFAAYLLAFAGIAALTGRLYGRRAAILSTAFAVLSLAFIPVFDYRPDHQIALASVWVVFATAQARFSGKRRWDFLAGLLGALSLELHAIGIAIVFALGLYHLAGAIYSIVRERRWRLRPLLAYGIGAAIGGAIYFGLNVVPVGGLTPFLNSLISERFQHDWIPTFLTLPSYLEGLIIFASFAFVIWRRQAEDRFLIGVMLCMGVALMIFDTQGYHSPVIALYAIPVGVLLGSAFEQRRAAVTFCVTAALIGQISTFILWYQLPNLISSRSFPAYAYDQMGTALKPYLRAGDVILTTHLLIWGLHDEPNLYSYAGEITAMRRWQLTDPAAVWERIQPTVVILVENQMTLNIGAQTYMSTHHFTVCEQMKVDRLNVTIYRPTC